MYNAVQTREKLLLAIDDFEHEVKVVYGELMLPDWDKSIRHFPQTLYGYMMGLFSRIDLLSAYWQGNEQNQTIRMIDFMDRYILSPREVNSVAVQMWRHKLMHTGEPRDLHDVTTGKPYRWLLHWWEHLPSEQHFTISETQDYKILNIGLVYAIAGVKRATESYVDEMDGSPLLQKNFAAMEIRLGRYNFKHY